MPSIPLMDSLNPLSKNFDNNYCNAFKAVLSKNEQGKLTITKDDFEYLCSFLRKQFNRLIEKLARTVHEDVGGYEEGISIGEEALMDAIYAFIKNNKYNENTPFICHLTLYIRSAIQKANRNTNLLMIPHNIMAEWQKAQRDNLFVTSDYDLTPEQLAVKDQLSSIHNMMNMSSLNKVINPEDSIADAKTLEEVIKDSALIASEELFDKEFKEMISASLDKLDVISRKSISMYYGIGCTEMSLREISITISKEYSSISHVSIKKRIEEGIIQLREYMLESESLLDFLED